MATRRITGPVDGADLMSDLAVLAGQVSGEGGSQRLEIRGPGEPVRPPSLP